MKNNLVKLLSVLAAVSAAGAASAQQVVYDNTTTKLAGGYTSLNEFGDQIILGGSSFNRRVSAFSLEYFTANTLSGNEGAQVRFYANNGAATGTNPQGFAPNTVLWDSGAFTIGAATTGTTLNWSGAAAPNVVVPDTFTYTIAFSGIEGLEVAGLDRYSPPTVGNNITDFWEKNGSTWELRSSTSGNMDFGARVTAVPEPGTLALGAMGLGLAAAAYARRKKS